MTTPVRTAAEVLVGVEQDGYATVAEACEYLAIGKSTLYELLRSGELPSRSLEVLAGSRGGDSSGTPGTVRPSFGESPDPRQAAPP